MSREILTVREYGYITRPDGDSVCWQIMFANGQYQNTHRLQGGFPFYIPNCSKWFNHYSNQLGPHAPPGPQNGFEVILGLGFCGNEPDAMIVRLLRGSNYYKARLYFPWLTMADNDENYGSWRLDEIDPSDVNRLCGEDVDITIIDPNAPEPPPPPTGSTGTDNFINQSIPIHIQYGVGAAIALAALLYFNFKK